MTCAAAGGVANHIPSVKTHRKNPSLEAETIPIPILAALGQEA
jgi:hypothetical protein